jgi:hypothetical protein
MEGTREVDLSPLGVITFEFSTNVTYLPVYSYGFRRKLQHQSSAHTFSFQKESLELSNLNLWKAPLSQKNWQIGDGISIRDPPSCLWGGTTRKGTSMIRGNAAPSKLRISRLYSLSFTMPMSSKYLAEVCKLSKSIQSNGPFDSSSVIKLEDIVVLGVLARSTRVNRDNIHIPQIQGLSVDAGPQLLRDIYTAFEDRKALFSVEDSRQTMNAAKSAVYHLRRSNSEAKRFSRDEVNLLQR